MNEIQAVTLPTAHGLQIRGDYLADTANPSAPIVIFAHGLGSTRRGEKAQAIAEECAQRGWAHSAFDFHGHGDSEGSMLDLRGSNLLLDLEAIIQFSQKRGHQNIFLVGSSMGGWAAAWFAALHPERIRACTLIAPAFRFLEWLRLTEAVRQRWKRTGRLPIINEWIDLELDYGLHAEAVLYPYTQLCERFATPCLIFHGMKDDTVPVEGSIDFTERCAASELPLWLHKNGDHRLNTHKNLLAQMTGDFFQRSLTQSWG